jgi:hypothetical protein
MTMAGSPLQIYGPKQAEKTDPPALGLGRCSIFVSWTCTAAACLRDEHFSYPFARGQALVHPPGWKIMAVDCETQTWIRLTAAPKL